MVESRGSLVYQWGMGLDGEARQPKLRLGGSAKGCVGASFPALGPGYQHLLERSGCLNLRLNFYLQRKGTEHEDSITLDQGFRKFFYPNALIGSNELR